MSESKRLILCIDDDPDVVSVLQIVLEAEGYAFAGAATAEEGLRVYAEVKPDLIIVDLMMEEVDAGATFVKVSDFEPQSLDFASAYKGLSSAGGPMHVTYDGGLTWLMQSGGGGICCHGNFVWAFDTMSAIWKDGGVGDPNGLSG